MAIYCISDNEGYCKIGYSEYPFERLRQLQTGNPKQLKMFAICSGDLQLETKFHLELQAFSTNGEWFHFNTESQEHIERLFYETRNPVFFIENK